MAHRPKTLATGAILGAILLSPGAVQAQPSAEARLGRYVLSARPENLAGTRRALLRSTKINELVHAARRGLTTKDVATFAQSAHPNLLKVFERGAKLPGGYFLSVTRSVQFPGGNPFQGKSIPSSKQERRYRQGIARTLLATTRLHRRRGGKGLSEAVQLLTSTAHLAAPKTPGEDLNAVRKAVAAIPVLELKRRHAYITGLKPSAILSQVPSRRALHTQKDLVNFKHLLGALGKQKDGKLLIEIYAENVPAKRRIDRYLPVTALGEGSYCVDDIARTTVALLQQNSRSPKPQLLAKAKQGLSFVKMMQARDGEFYNFANLKHGKLSVNKNGETSKKGIDFWAARALWAMGEGYGALKTTSPREAKSLARAISRTVKRLEGPLNAQYGRYIKVEGKRYPSWLINDAADTTAVAMKGLLSFYRAAEPGKLRDRVERVIARYADGIARAQVTDPKAPDHGRFIHAVRSPRTTHLWGSRQVEVLAEAGKLLGRGSWIQAARRCADHYWGKRTPVSITGAGEEQIAYGMETVVSGYARLHEATRDSRYAKQTYRWASWFFGNNRAHAVVYDPISGRGYDGIRSVKDGRKKRYSVNSNAGAESTVEAVLALQSAARVPGVHSKLRKQLERNLPK